MGLVLAIVGAFLYVGLASALDESIGAGLRARAGDVTALVQQADSGLREGGATTLADEGENFAQVLDLSGGVVDSTPGFARAAALPAEQLATVGSGALLFDRVTVAGLEDPFRLLATAVVAQERPLVVVVGTSLERRDETLSLLRAQQLLGWPLRPVESMRREASAISASEPGRRLPVPRAKDELALLSTTLNDMLARLETAIARERSFVSDASHELRTPLSLLKIELELALAHERTPDEQRAALRSAAVETDRLAQLAEDLLVLARSDQGRLQLRSEEIGIGRVLEDVRERFARRAADLGRDLVVEAPPDLLAAADRLRLEQALSNLVENALRHGRGDVTLRACLGESGNAEIHVLDEGPGFEAGFLPRAFERFSRGDEARSGGGAGLGLAIAAVIAGAHGGSIHAANREDGGGDVWLSLPVSRRRKDSLPS
jgi:signal transduction histidine kinase